MFDKILIANRGEIACRVIRTARRLGIATVAVYSDADAKAMHVRQADEAVRIGGAASRDSYLKGDIIIQAALDKGAQAIHPGYGFLSENSGFAAACAKAGIVFIGPSPESIDAMGLKDRAKAIMAKAGVPVVPGYQGDNQDVAVLKKEAGRIGYPVLIKAVAGGGGKGMRLVESAGSFAEALASCQREAQNAFGNPHVLIEKYINKPRHVEVQVFGDSHGNAVHLYERDCSLQRRHQKVVEEAPAPGLPEKTRAALGEAAVKAVKALTYANAGTIEFIMDSATNEFFFMEMNTRLQVEHPVTEMITGLDLVEWQLRVAAGERLPLAQKDIPMRGHAFEVRLYAEDPSNNFLPQIGRIAQFLTPLSLSSSRRRPGPTLDPGARANTMPGQSVDPGRSLSSAKAGGRDDDETVRIDTGIESGDFVTIHYDPMIAKIITHGPDRATAIAAMRRALGETLIAGLITNQEFLANIFRDPAFAAGDVDTGFIARHEASLLPADYGRPDIEDITIAALHFIAPASVPASDPWAVSDNWRLNTHLTRTLTLLCRDEPAGVTITGVGASFNVTLDDRTLTLERSAWPGLLVGDERAVTLVRDGRVMHISVPDPAVAGGEGEGEGRILAPMPGRIVSVLVGQGDAVKKDQPILIMEAMKMEMTIRAGRDGLVDDLPVAVNDQVQDGALLFSIGQGEAA